MTNADPIRVLIVDDHPVFRKGLRALLATVPDITVVGEAIFSPAIAERMIAFFSAPPVRPAPTFPELTESERNVLRLMARGLKNDAIATELFLSPKTVRNYISSIFGKLQVADRGQAIVRARDEGL